MVIKSIDVSEKFSKYSISDRCDSIFTSIILCNKRITLEKLESQYYVGKSLILNDINYMNEKYLYRFDVKFETSYKFIEIVGTEIKIQAICIDYICEARSVIEYFKSYDKSMSDYCYKGLVVSILVFVDRFKNRNM